jgi:EAL domain-containing protein (putative c-di-GMP-specific phosphodiesterase class I)
VQRGRRAHLSIDDFGTGYSSLAYLQSLPDQPAEGGPHVRARPCRWRATAIATAIIAMAHSLGLTVVAEGVETLGQLEFLRRAGCDIMQGFYFARPMPGEELTALLRRQQEAVAEGV